MTKPESEEQRWAIFCYIIQEAGGWILALVTITAGVTVVTMSDPRPEELNLLSFLLGGGSGGAAMAINSNKKEKP